MESEKKLYGENQGGMFYLDRHIKSLRKIGVPAEERIKHIGEIFEILSPAIERSIKEDAQQFA